MTNINLGSAVEEQNLFVSITYKGRPNNESFTCYCVQLPNWSLIA